MLLRGLARTGTSTTRDAIVNISVGSSHGLLGRRVAAFGFRALATEAGESSAVGKEVSATTSTTSAASSLGEGAKASLNPHAPIRKFFEEQTVGLGPSGMPLPVRTGRPWFARELRSKSFEDLHRLHFVLLMERNKLLNEKIRHRKTGRVFPSPERLQTVRRSMARLQTVLTERAWETRFQRIADEMMADHAQAGDAAAAAPSLKADAQPEERSEMEEKWRNARDKQRKPAKQRPRSVKASGGQKTNRKMIQAEQFAAATEKYIEELGVSRGRSDEPERPRWRDLSDEARRVMRHKQQLARSSKVARSKAQSEEAKNAKQA